MQNKEQSKLPMAMFGLGLIGCIVMLIFLPEYSWIPLPFLLTGLARLLNAI